MEHNQPPVNTFYEKYKNQGVLFSAIPAVSALLVINTTGIIANMTVVVITILSKNLRSTANYLLAMECFSHSVHILAHYYFAYVLYTGKNFDTLPTCLHVMTVPLVGLMIGIFLTFFIALDRFLATLFPVKHQRMNKILYLGSILGICVGITTYIMYIAYINAEEHKETMVICLIIEGFHGGPSKFMPFTVFGIIFGAVLIYIIIGFYIRCKGNSSPSTKRLFKSLLILCVIMTFSWVIASASGILSFALGLSEELTFFIPLYLGITVNIACASNFFVLTRYSSEYRTAAREFFNRFGITTFFQPIAGNGRIFDISTRLKPTITIMPKESTLVKVRKGATNVIG